MEKKQTVSDFLLDRLSAWGVTRIYGYPGDGINPIIGALRRAGDRFQFVQAAHEEQAALMACAHAKYSGQLGVVLATQGPGAIHILNGLYDAKLDHQPVLAIVGQPSSISLGSSFQQEIDLVSLFKDVAHEYVQQVSTPSRCATRSTAPPAWPSPSGPSPASSSTTTCSGRTPRPSRPTSTG